MYSTESLKSFRGRRLKSQDEVASQLGISRQAYNNYENNLLECDLNLIFKILGSMQVSKTELQEFLNAVKQDYSSYYEDKLKKNET